MTGHYSFPKVVDKFKFNDKLKEFLRKQQKKEEPVNKPPMWSQVYPQGTPQGDEEQKFFIALSRNKKYRFRSVAHLAKESGLTKERVEELIEKYSHLGMVFQDPKNEDQWGYWEKCPELLPKPFESICHKDQKRRIKQMNHRD
jgi:hypothetical protein